MKLFIDPVIVLGYFIFIKMSGYGSRLLYLYTKPLIGRGAAASLIKLFENYIHKRISSLSIRPLAPAVL